VANFVHIEDDMGRNTLNDLDGALKEHQDRFSCDIKPGFLHRDSRAGLDATISVEDVLSRMLVDRLLKARLDTAIDLADQHGRTHLICISDCFD
jgi:hypothetical protein